MRVFNEDGTWNQLAVDVIGAIRSDLQEIFDKLEARGMNFREASVLLHTAVLDEELNRALVAKKFSHNA